MKRLVLLLAFFVAGLCFVIVPSAIADKPPAPPGQGECNHGNSNQPCKPDPSTNGKDCDPHGNNGGVNEDHCLGTTPSTTTTTTKETTSTTETTQTHQTTSTPTGTSPNQTTSNSTQPSPPVTTTTQGVTTTPSATPSPDAAPPVKSKTPNRVKVTANNKAQGKLPFTGFKLWMAFALGGIMLLTGLVLRRRTD